MTVKCIDSSLVPLSGIKCYCRLAYTDTSVYMLVKRANKRNWVLRPPPYMGLEEEDITNFIKLFKQGVLLLNKKAKFTTKTVKAFTVTVP